MFNLTLDILSSTTCMSVSLSFSANFSAYSNFILTKNVYQLYHFHWKVATTLSQRKGIFVYFTAG